MVYKIVLLDNKKISKLSTIFNKFYQADTSHKSEGNGLGLALVKQIIDLLCGEISVRSQVGVGTTFLITLTK